MKMLLTSILTLGISILTFAGTKDKPLKELTSVRESYQLIQGTIDEAMEKVFFSSYNDKGDMIIKRKYKVKEPITIPYNMSRLPTGDYQVKIETENEVAVYEVKTFSKANYKLPLMAYGTLKEQNTVTLLVVGLEKPGVTVDIYDQLGSKIGSDYIDQPEGFSKDYKFVGQEADRVYFHLKDAQGRTKNVYPRTK